jgi:hypothetical protein
MWERQRKYSGSWSKAQKSVIKRYPSDHNKRKYTHLPTRILRSLLAWPIALVLRRGIKYVEEHTLIRAHLQYTRHIPTAVTVIWSGPDGRQVAVEEGSVALHAELVRAQDVRESVRA